MTENTKINSKVEKVNETSVKVNIKVELSQMNDIVEKVYKELSESVKASGFRKGKIPKAIINQKVGVNYVINEIVNEAISKFYQQAALDNSLKVMGQPAVDIVKLIDLNNSKSVLEFNATVDVRPEIKIPDLSGTKIDVEIKKVTKEDIENELKTLQTRFSTKNEDGTVVTPEINDEFAKNFEIDTLKELKDKISEDLENRAVSISVGQAGDKILDIAMEKITVKLPEKVVDTQINHFLSNGGAKDPQNPTDEEKKLAKKRAEKDISSQVFLDTYADENNIGVSQEEIMNYAYSMSSQYGISPEQFLQYMIQNNQMPMMAAEVSRSKTLAHMLRNAKVVDQNGKELDLSPWIGSEDDNKSTKSTTVKTKARKTTKKSTADKSDSK